MSSIACDLAGVVVATAHDSPTCFVAEAAHQVVPLLNEAGYRVLSYLEHRATLPDLYTSLAEFHVSFPSSRLCLGFVSAHGSDQGPHEAPTQTNPNGEVLLESQTCRQFEEAILVYFSCTQTGTFPNSVLALPPSPQRPGRSPVKAIIGYRKVFVVPPRDFILKISSKAHCDRLIALFVAHVELLLQGYSAVAVVTEIRNRWDQESRRREIPDEMQMVCLANRNNIRCWPHDSEACLP